MIDEALNNYVPKLEARIKNSIPMSSGALRNSIVVSYDGEDFVIDALNYFQWIEFGAEPSAKKPSAEMIDNVLQWMKVEGIRPQVRVRDKKGKFRQARNLNDERKQAFLIAKGILQSGKAPKGIISNQLEQIAVDIGEEIGILWQQTT